MSDEEFNRDELCAAVGEDNDLEPLEKEMQIRWSKAGEPLPESVPYDDPVVWVYSEIRGPCRRLLRRSNFWPTELRVEGGRKVAPHNFSGERITGVGGYIPRGSLKLQGSIRSDSTHASVVSNDWSESNSSVSSSGESSEPSKNKSQDGTDGEDTDSDADDGDAGDTTNPLDW
ncbi:hypothetical protein [Natrinema longum]|uniref:Uncharacterized protein n=1 Tax=Natrinema longum TaxID=370324 RepID=A0A8A2U467_9EURY|nr:hypothetical protein [Natrinema longum]MBZ6494803.1 hypothetical protein [Natrinema longum]QSW83889.1 hypothetical protein J0X27_10450 [Natrinema longum]